MLKIYHVWETPNNFFRCIARTIIYDKNLFVSCLHNTLKNTSNTRCLIVRSHQKTEIAKFYLFHGVQGVDDISFEGGILDSRRAISLTRRVISSLFFSLFARRSRTKYMRKIILVYTSTSAPLGIPNTFPKKSNTEGKKVKIRSPAPTERKTRK
jgi:hypothetical protein